jgi:seryl-tRNA synthetase
VLPNVPLDDVPVGADENDNVEVRLSGQKPAFDFEPKEHFELGEALGQMDFETAAKLSGSRFTVVRAVWRGWSGRSASSCSTRTPASTAIPKSIRRFWCAMRRMYGTGQLPKFGEDLFQTTRRLLADSRRPKCR